MVLTDSLCDAPHILCLSYVNNAIECIYALDYTADLSAPILDRCRKKKEGEIGSSTCRPNYIIIIINSINWYKAARKLQGQITSKVQNFYNLDSPYNFQENLLFCVISRFQDILQFIESFQIKIFYI